MQPNIIQGTVVSQQTNEPLPNVHVNILYNDAETTSSNNGSFTLRLWQTFPVTLVIAHQQFHTKFVKVQSASKDFTISLQPNA